MVLSNKEWLDKMDEIISAIQNGGDSQVIEDMLSNMWISSVTYNVGDYVLYNNNIWKCLVQNSNIAPSEGTTWTRVNITSEISTLNSNFSKINHIKTIDFVNGISFKWTVAGLQPIIDSSEQLPLLKNITNSNGYIKSITLDYSSNWQLKIIFNVDGIDYEKYISLS